MLCIICGEVADTNDDDVCESCNQDFIDIGFNIDTFLTDRFCAECGGEMNWDPNKCANECHYCGEYDADERYNKYKIPRNQSEFYRRIFKK